MVAAPVGVWVVMWWVRPGREDSWLGFGGREEVGVGSLVRGLWTDMVGVPLMG